MGRSAEWISSNFIVWFLTVLIRKSIRLVFQQVNDLYELTRSSSEDYSAWGDTDVVYQAISVTSWKALDLSTASKLNS